MSERVERDRSLRGVAGGNAAGVPRHDGGARLIRRLSRAIGTGLFYLCLGVCASATEWQWSVPMGAGRAFLWIPPDCAHVRGVVLGQHNMIEEGILEHDTLRRALAKLGFAEVFVAPPFDPVFRFDQGAGARTEAMMRDLAATSGYGELVDAPVVPMGHSACASFPWNFAAANPGRTLAILSVKGDAPLTNLTGSGRPNPAWGSRTIDGIPALMVMSEDEWWDARLAPALAYRAAHPLAPIALWADVGRSHFDSSDRLVAFLAEFITQAAAARLPRSPALPGAAVALQPVDPAAGWLVDRWRGEEPPRAAVAPYSAYRGDRSEAFWIFDGEMARETEADYASSRGKKAQQVDFVQDGTLSPISTTHAGVQLRPALAADGLTFRISGDFIVPLPRNPPVAAKDQPPPPRTVTPDRAPEGTHARGPVRITRITGPAVAVGADRFRIQFNRTFMPGDRRNDEIWLLAENPGDAIYRSAVQQAVVRLPVNRTGTPQRIVFAPIPNQMPGVRTVTLHATSDAGLPVGYYVREGPAELDGDTLRFTAIPVRARYPIPVTVVAWQCGTPAKVQAATPVERTFLIQHP